MAKGVMAYPEGAVRRAKEIRHNYVSYPHEGLECEEETRTKQEFKDECDINNIMKRYTKGELPEMIRQNPEYGDFSDPIDYRAAMDIVNLAKEQFEALPSAVREKFHNNPENFLAWTSDASNAEEMAKMGLMTPEAVKRVNEAKKAKADAEFKDKVDKEIEKRSKEPKKT